jgi:hypothetical protein
MTNPDREDFLRVAREHKGQLTAEERVAFAYAEEFYVLGLHPTNTSLTRARSIVARFSARSARR